MCYVIALTYVTLLLQVIKQAKQVVTRLDAAERKHQHACAAGASVQKLNDLYSFGHKASPGYCCTIINP